MQVTLLVLAYYTMGGMLRARRGTVVGLLAIATYLFIQFSQDFLTLVSCISLVSIARCLVQ
jgi:hypothetical protein